MGDDKDKDHKTASSSSTATRNFGSDAEGSFLATGGAGQQQSAWKGTRNSSLAAATFSVHSKKSNEVNSSRDTGVAQSSMNVTNFVTNKFEVGKRTAAGRKRLTQLASFVPDFILLDEGQRFPYIMTHEAVTLMADVSGFTALTEKYSLKGNGGNDQLTKTLSSYMGPLAECILRAGGDIIKYAGDAILAVWKVYDTKDYPQEVQRATDCALYIQEKYGSMETDVGITITVKLGIGAGKIYQCGIGNQDYHQFVCYGPGVESCSNAEKHCISGEVILAEGSWKLVDSDYFTYTVKDSSYRRVTEITAFVNPELRGRPMQNLRRTVLATRAMLSLNNPGINIRPVMFDAIEKKSELQLRHFVIPPVLKKLDDDLPLEFLNESRIASICFIKIDLKPFEVGVPFGETMMGIVQMAFKYIYKNCTLLQGCLSKIIMFDKGLTYLVIFGLPGYIHDNQSAHALKFSYRVKSQLNSIRHVQEVSLGVTSGQTYCGVLGHYLRQEYTVLGRTVNKAARLMVYYPGRVTCDQDTLYHSKLPVHHFSLMEFKPLKGIQNVGNIYEYLGAETGEDQSVKTFDYPMVGRDMELKYFKTIMDGVLLEMERFVQAHRLISANYDLKNTKDIAASGLWILVIEGDIGIGKSRLLAACIQESEERGIKVFSVEMNALLATQRLYAIQSLMLQAFGMDEMRTPQEREEHLRKAVGDDPDLAAKLCLLNDLFRLKFPAHSKFTGADITSRHALAQHILAALLRRFFPEEVIVLCIDDAHLCDPSSWEYLQALSTSPNVFTIVSIRRNIQGSPKLADPILKIIYHNKNVKTVRLLGIDPKYSLILACQAMEVASIPQELERIIMNKSQGVPAWIDQVLKEMLRSGLLKIVGVEVGTSKYRALKMSEVQVVYITPIKRNKKIGRKKMFDFHSDADSVPQLSNMQLQRAKSDSHLMVEQSSTALALPIRVQKEVIRPEVRMCVVKSDTNIGTAPIPGTLKEILLDAFDELESNEQMLLKCAAVCGLRFSRYMVVRIVPSYEMNMKKYELGFRRLMVAGVLRCASRPVTADRRESAAPGVLSAEQVPCFCKMTKAEERRSSVVELANSSSGGTITSNAKSDKIKPNYYFCKYMEFAKENMVDVVYELMTEDQRKELHLKAAKYLDTSLVRCRLHGADPSEYQFGFQLKGSDLGGDNEEALRSAVMYNRKKRSSAGRRGALPAVKMDRRPSKNKRKQSLAARMDGLKRLYQTAGDRIGDIEVDILKGLDTLKQKAATHKSNTSFFKCGWCRSKRAEEDAKEWDFTLSKAIKMEKDADNVDDEDNVVIVETRSAGGGDTGETPTLLPVTDSIMSNPSTTSNPSNASSGSPRTSAATAPPKPRRSTFAFPRRVSRTNRNSTGSLGGDSTGGPGSSRLPSSALDFRGCECSILQAKVSVEMVKHYRRAEKFGKCLFNLLDAAEASVTNGNSGQSLVHLEDTIALMHALKDKDLPEPDPNDTDDAQIDYDKVTLEIEFLSGLAYFELGVRHKASDNFSRVLSRLGLNVPSEDDKIARDAGIMSASTKLWRRHTIPLPCCKGGSSGDGSEADMRKQDIYNIKLRTLSYLHKLFRNERKPEMALLIALWQALVAEDMNSSFMDIIPAYCALMETYSLISNHKKAEYYEKLSMEMIRDVFGTKKQQEMIGLLTCANLFHTTASIRLVRGDITSATEAAYLSLRIAEAIHDNALSIHVVPMVIQSLLFSLRISEMIEGLQKLWYIAEEEEDWGGVAIYYTLCLDLLLNTAYPMEPFYTCENFVNNSDWNSDIQMYREYEVQYNMEASLALWYCRYSRWDGALRWKALAESHRPKVTTFLSVSAELKLLESNLILVNHYLESKRYQHFAKARNSAKELMRILKKSTAVVPIFQARFEHLTAYYCRIRSRIAESEKHLRKAQALALLHSNSLELEWILHNRKVWTDTAVPTLKFFWLEHTENHSLDWHQSDSVPWTNIMYSLPLPSWKT